MFAPTDPAFGPDFRVTPHFTLGELWCPCCHTFNLTNLTRLCRKLEVARGSYGPMTIASAFRCQLHNLEQGGKLMSRHLEGLAADIAVYTDGDRFRLMAALLNAGFRRIGVMKNAIHADVGETQVNVLWTYYK
ncbi:peptidase M15 [candidate division WOR-3 bacterium]|nr:peptidase M15 [candidate division WOR-3 bacterium]